MFNTHLRHAIIVIASLSGVSPVLAFNFTDITFWTGSGVKESALVIDWADGSTPLAWGYRWDGSATGRQMFEAIAAADPRLFFYPGDTSTTNTAGDGTGGANSIYGLGYDSDGDGFALVPGSSDTGSALDGDDRYAEGWFAAGYWAYFVNIDNNEFNYFPPDYLPEVNLNFGDPLGDPYDGGSWGFSGLGFLDTVLFEGSWDGWAFAPSFSGSSPATPIAATAPVPEPLSVMLFIAAGTGLSLRRRA